MSKCLGDFAKCLRGGSAFLCKEAFMRVYPPHKQLSKLILCCLIITITICSFRPVTAAVSYNLDSAFVRLSQWLGFGRESNVPSSFSSASLIELENKEKI